MDKDFPLGEVSIGWEKIGKGKTQVTQPVITISIKGKQLENSQNWGNIY